MTTTTMESAADRQPRAGRGRAPDVFVRGGWVPMREYRDEEAVDFAIVGTGAGGGTLACKLAEAGFSVVALDAGPYWRPLEDFASDEDRADKLYWTDERIIGGDDPDRSSAATTAARRVGGSTVHFAMVSLRFRPEWFKCALDAGLRRGLADRSGDEMWHYYAEVEQALKIAGPVSYPWGPQRAALSLSAARAECRRALVLARGCEALGIDWAPTPLATLSAPRGKAHPCVYRGFCDFGCSTNAKQSALVTWIPRAIARRRRNPRSRDGRPDRDRPRRPGAPACTIIARAGGGFQRARNVVVAGYAIETPRLLLNSACRAISRRPRQQLGPGRQEPDGAVEPGGLGHDRRGNALVQGAAVAGHHRALELHRRQARTSTAAMPT